MEFGERLTTDHFVLLSKIVCYITARFYNHTLVADFFALLNFCPQITKYTQTFNHNIS